MVAGTPYVLHITGAIADPNISFILMVIGLAGLYFELAHPGVALPGVVGRLCLLLAFFTFQVVPINFISILLILLAFILFILEFKIISYGLLTLGGWISLVIGSMMLFRRGEMGDVISWWVLILTVAVVSLLFIMVAGVVFCMHSRRSMIGIEAMVGEGGVVYTALAPEGLVFIQGEYWEAVSEEPVAEGEIVEVVMVENLKLRVRRVL